MAEKNQKVSEHEEMRVAIPTSRGDSNLKGEKPREKSNIHIKFYVQNKVI